MSDTSDLMAEAVKLHADLILRASGSGLRNYTMPSTRNAILGSVMDCYEEAYRAGAQFAGDRLKDHIERIEALNAETVSALRDIVEFCDDPTGSENGETLAVGLARLLPSARAALTKADTLNRECQVHE